MTNSQNPGQETTPFLNKALLFQSEEGIDFKRYFSLFLSNWYWFAISLFISLSISYSINRWSEKVYSITSSILIKDDQIGGYSEIAPIFPGTESFKTRQNLRNEMGILRSYNLNRRVIDSLPEFHVEYVGVGRRGIAESRLYKNSPFVVVYDSLINKTFNYPVNIKIESSDSFSLSIGGKKGFTKVMKFGDKYSDDDFSFSIILRDSAGYIYDGDLSNKYYFIFRKPEKLANLYRSRLNITPIDEDASLVTLSVSGFVPDQEADYLNELMDVYLAWGLEVKNKTAENTIEFIEGQVDHISESLSDTEDSLVYFRLSNRFVDLSNEGLMVQDKLEKYGEERSVLFLQRDYFNYLQGYISDKEKMGEIIAPSMIGISDLFLERSIMELSALQKQYRDLLLTLSPDMPAVKLVQDGISEKVKSLQANVESNLDRIEISIKDVEQRISGVEKEISRLPDTERKLIGIQRKFDLDNTVYTYLLEKKAEADIALASTVSDNNVIDYADINNVMPVKPRKSRNRLIGFLLGILIPASGIVVIDYFNNKIIDRRDIERATDVPVLGFISHNDYRSEIPVLSRTGSTLAESFRSVRTALKYYKTPDEKVIISISSTVSSEGKTFISVNLAAILALLGKKVLLVGLDLRKPRLHKILQSDNNMGMSTFLSGNADYSEIIKKSDVENLWYAPSGPVPPNPAELIESENMAIFLRKSREDFDYVILDTPPVAIVTDALLLAPYSDINIFVVRQRYSSKNTLGLIQELYHSGKFKNLALVINDISLSGYYGYGLRYGYAMGYGGYNYGYNLYGEYTYSTYGYSRDSHYYTDDEEDKV